MASVSIRKLGVAFGNLKVLEDLDLEVAGGEFIVLLGASGCGKSTLLNAIAGLLDIDAGQIWIGDKNVTWEEPTSAAFRWPAPTRCNRPRTGARRRRVPLR